MLNTHIVKFGLCDQADKGTFITKEKPFENSKLEIFDDLTTLSLSTLNWF